MGTRENPTPVNAPTAYRLIQETLTQADDAVIEHEEKLEALRHYRAQIVDLKLEELSDLKAAALNAEDDARLRED